MKTSLNIFLTGLVLWMASAISYADDEAKNTDAQTDKNRSRVVITIIAGTVTKVDTEKKSFEVKLSDEKTSTFKIGDETRFRKDGELMPFENLAVGNYVRFLLREKNDGSIVPGQVFVLEKPPVTEEKPAPKEEPVPANEK